MKEILVLIENGDEIEMKESDDKAKWARAQVNNLPDSAFLYVESDGDKDDENKTVPRSLRHLPYKNADGSVDLPHLRNALSRLGQPVTGATEGDGKWLTEDLRKKLITKAHGMLKEEQKALSEEQVSMPDVEEDEVNIEVETKSEDDSETKQVSECICPECDYKMDHESGKLCRSETCPECGAKMAGATDAETVTASGNAGRAVIAQNAGQIESQVKSGRRVRSEKLSFVKRVAQEIDDLKSALMEFVGWGNYEDEEESTVEDVLESSIALKAMSDAAEYGSSLVSFKGSDGRDWLLTFTTNAFEDREGEIFATKSIEDYISRHEDDDIKGEYQFWHLPGTKFGDIRWQGTTGRFLVEAGTFDDTPVGNAFKEFFNQNPNGHPDIAADGWGCSHKYEYKSDDRKDGVYNWFEKSETTVLPLDAAANPYTLPVFLQKEFAMNEKQRKDLELIGGGKLVSMVEFVGNKATEELEATVAYKAKKPNLIAEMEAIAGDMEDGTAKKGIMSIIKKMRGMPEYAEDEDEKKKESGEQVEATVKEDEKEELVVAETNVEVGESTEVTEQELAEGEPEPVSEPVDDSTEKEYQHAVAESFTTLATHFGNQINGLVNEVKGLREELANVQRSDEVKIAEKAELTPAASLLSMVQRAVGAKETRVDGRSVYAKDGPKQTQPLDKDGPTDVPLLNMFMTSSDQRR